MVSMILVDEKLCIVGESSGKGRYHSFGQRSMMIAVVAGDVPMSR